MKHLKTYLMMVLALSFSGAVPAEVFVWNPSATGGWREKARYFNEDGVTGATRSPQGGDIVNIPAGCTVEVSTDEDAAFVNALRGVYLVGSDSTFVLDAPSPIRWGAAVCGNGVFIKRTAAEVELLPNTQTDLMDRYKGCFTAYRTLSGLVVEKGKLLAPQNASSGGYFFGPLVLSNDVVFAASTNAATRVTALYGYGTVTNAATEQTCQFTIGVDGIEAFAENHRYSRFYGTFHGPKLGVQTLGTVYLYNDGSTCGGDPRVYGRDGDTADDRVGNLFFSGPGALGVCSWMNVYASGALHYLGEGYCRFNKQITYHVTEPYPMEIDGGEHGGLVLSGAVIHKSDSYRMGRVVLSGDGDVPNVVSGKWTTASSSGGTNYTTYIAKTGTGTWRFANPESAQSGALAIREGTLQFDSIAEQGDPCALGTSSVLYDDVYGLRKDENKVGYAFLLGSDGAYPTFEYTGAGAASCSTRPLALAGQGGRLSVAPGASLDFSGVYAVDGGEKTLTLAGSTEGNVIRGISGGSGTVALAKEGTGTWTVRGGNGFSGTLKVSGGTLLLRDRMKEKYNYYRLVIKDDYGEARMYLNEFALYDAGGVNRAYGVTELFPEGSEGGTAYGFYNTRSVSDLGYSQALAHHASGRKYYIRLSDGKPANQLKHLFAGDATNYDCLFDLSSYANDHPQPDKPETWYYITVRLPENCPEIVRYDICLNATWALSKNPKRVAVWASVTGADDDWDVVSGDLQLDNTSTAWAGSGVPFVKGDAARPDQGVEIAAARTDPDDGGSTMMDGVESVQVAPGAILKTLGEKKTIRGITLDAASPGMGEIDGFTFASAVTIDVVNAGDDWKELELPVDFSGISIPGDVVWKLTMDGESTRFNMTVADGRVKITRPGFVLTVR